MYRPSRLKSGRGKFCSKICSDKASIGRVAWNDAGIYKNCLICQKQFKISPRRIRKGTGKYCSAKCFGISRLGKAYHTQKHSEETKAKLRLIDRSYAKGSGNVNWKGGITKLQEKIRKLPKYNDWRLSIFLRDKFTCRICNTYSKKDCEADHYPESFAQIIDEYKINSIENALANESLWNMENGRTLCQNCHRNTLTYFKQLKDHPTF